MMALIASTDRPGRCHLARAAGIYENTRDTFVSVRSNTASGTKKSPASGPLAPGA